ncbi:MAG: hypothetical protein OXC46_04250 [Thaumarchaeota archaeon]|nr:hypothetical protein [Nitrososphaerota archaeon]
MKTMIPLILIFILTPAIANAQVSDIFIVTDKPKYAIGETIILNGTITEYYQDAITIQVTAPNGNLVTVKQIPAELEFQVEIVTGGPLMTSTGTYDIDALYGEAFTGTSFEYGGTPVSNVEQSTSPFVQPERPDPNYLLTATTIGAPVPTGEFDSNYALALHGTTMITMTMIGISMVALISCVLVSYKITSRHISKKPKVNTTTSAKRTYTKRKPITNLDAPI